MPMVGRSEQGDRQFSEKFLDTHPHTNALSRIRDLVKMFTGEVWIVSRAGQRVEALTRKWLLEKDFFAVTGLKKDHLLFCLERLEKEPICRDLGITHFVDDRIHIMQVLRNTVEHLYLFGDKERNRKAPRWAVLVGDWNEAYSAIVEDLPY